MPSQPIPFQFPWNIGLQVKKNKKKTAPENIFLISLLSDELEIFNIAQVEVQEVDNLMLDDNH